MLQNIMWNYGKSNGMDPFITVWGPVIAKGKSFYYVTINPIITKHEMLCENSRILGVKLWCNENCFYLFNVYGPNLDGEKGLFFNDINSIIQRLCKDDQYIIAGDFNTVGNNALDIISGMPHQVTSVQLFNEFQAKWKVHDVWRLFHEEERQYTWHKSNPFVARRLDYILCSSILFDNAVGCEIIAVPGTDHRGVCIHMQFQEESKGPSYWKLNDYLLKDEKYVELVHNVIEDTLNNFEGFDERVLWDLCKIKIRESSIAYSKNKARVKKNLVASLREKIEVIDKQLSNDPSNDLYPQRIKVLQEEMELINEYDAKGAQIRSRTKWMEEGEKNTKYFLGLEKTRALRNTITQLKTDTENLISDQSEIHHQISTYYRDLYTNKVDFQSETKNFDKFVSNLNIPQIPCEAKIQCDEIISLDELEGALKELNDKSAPGHDGLTPSFYKHFWHVIGPLVHASFIKAFHVGQLSLSQRRAVIIQIHKGKGLTRDILKNWRPISLTNTDYKILAKALAIRIQYTLNNVINDDQVGYLKGRNIATIIRFIDDVIEMIRYNKQTGGIVALDYCKAFDSINKAFLQKSFELFGFGPKFKKWVRVLMENNYSCVQHNGWLSEWFPVESGIRQGCPFSPLCFILAVEILAIKIRECNTIKGIALPRIDESQTNCSAKIQQYADDTTIFVKDCSDLNNAIKIVDQFSKFSGLRLNRNKCEGMWVGSPIPEGMEHVMRWCKKGETVKILGVHYSPSKPASEISQNWDIKIQAIVDTIKLWNRRQLSPHGKVLVAKTFLLSKLIYILQSIHIPQFVVQKIDQLLYKFIWQNKFSDKKAFEKVKRSVLNSSVERGGLNMISVKDMQGALEISWVKKLIQQEGARWTIIPYHEYKKFGGVSNVFKSNVTVKRFRGLETIHNPFWKNIISSWLERNSTDVVHFLDVPLKYVEDESLWNNDLICYKGNPLYFPKWAQAGINKVGHMFDIAGSLLSLEQVGAVVGHSADIWFSYNAICNALPVDWRQASGIVQHQVNPQFWDKDIMQHSCSTLRDTITGLNYTRPCGAAFWEKKFSFTFSNELWLIPKQCTSETRLLALQWKILHNIYPTSIMLFKMKLRDNHFCQYCPNEIDYIEHFFYHCRVCLPLWDHVFCVLSAMCGKRMTFSARDVLLGVCKSDVYSTEEWGVINLCLIIAKMCISKHKYGTPSHLKSLFDKEFLFRKKYVPEQFLWFLEYWLKFHMGQVMRVMAVMLPGFAVSGWQSWVMGAAGPSRPAPCNIVSEISPWKLFNYCLNIF